MVVHKGGSTGSGGRGGRKRVMSHENSKRDIIPQGVGQGRWKRGGGGGEGKYSIGFLDRTKPCHMAYPFLIMMLGEKVGKFRAGGCWAGE